MQPAAPTPSTADGAVSDAASWYNEALDASSSQREQIREDLEFTDPTNPQQWDAKEKRERESDSGGSRPCLVMDQIGQYIANVAGQIEQRPPALHAIPVDSGADKRVAEKLDGFFRHIEHVSRAQQHSARVLTSAARSGVGYYIVRPEYTDRRLNYQEPRISSEGDPLRVVFDPWSQEIDGSDAKRAVLLTHLSHAEFERQFGAKRDKISFGRSEPETDQRESIIVAEEWRIESKTRKMVVYSDNGVETTLPREQFAELALERPDIEDFREYSDKTTCVRWVRLSGAEVLTPETEYPASGIGIVPVYGYVTYIDGRLKYCGMGRRAREPQRAYNYHASEIRSLMAAAPRAPYVADVRAIAGFERLWDRANVEQRAYLPVHGVDEAGNPIPSPQRTQVAINLANHTQGMLQAREDIQAALGMYAANIGKQSNAQSGVAYDAQKEQGEASTAHFPSHLAASLSQVGKLVMEMIPRLIDEPRQVRILGIDQTPSQVRIDPRQEQALVEQDGAPLSINPNRGHYDVRVVVGASYATQRQQAQEAYTEMMRANPAMMPAIAPLWAQTLDVPHADKLAQVLTAMAPDPVKAILNPDQTESVASLKAENEQLKAKLQEVVQIVHEAQQDADEAADQLRQKQIEGEAREDEVAIKAYEAATRRVQVVGTLMQQGAQAEAQMAQQEAERAMQQQLRADQEAEQMRQAQEAEQQQLMAAQAKQQEDDVTAQQVQQLMAGQEQIAAGQEQMAALLGRLITLVQAERRRIPVRNEAGDITEVIDRLVTEQQAPEALQ